MGPRAGSESFLIEVTSDGTEPSASPSWMSGREEKGADYPCCMDLRKAEKWFVVAGVVAGLALPSVGTFYALRLEYPNDHFLLGMAIISWSLMGVAAALLVVGVAIVVVRAIVQYRDRSFRWATEGAVLRDRIEYLDRIAEREVAEFTRMYVAEQTYRDDHDGRSGSHLANAERLIKQSEAVEAKHKVAQARAAYLKIAPRHERRRIIDEWTRIDRQLDDVREPKE